MQNKDSNTKSAILHKILSQWAMLCNLCVTKVKCMEIDQNDEYTYL